jgi:hypothetical protein
MAVASEKKTLFLSDSLLKFITVRGIGNRVCFKKSRQHDGYDPISINPKATINVPSDGRVGAVFQAVFSGWTMGESITDFHMNQIQALVGNRKSVTAVYFVIGINDIRLVSISSNFLWPDN